MFFTQIFYFQGNLKKIFMPLPSAPPHPRFLSTPHLKIPRNHLMCPPPPFLDQFLVTGLGRGIGLINNRHLMGD